MKPLLVFISLICILGCQSKMNGDVAKNSVSRTVATGPVCSPLLSPCRLFMESNIPRTHSNQQCEKIFPSLISAAYLTCSFYVNNNDLHPDTLATCNSYFKNRRELIYYCLIGMRNKSVSQATLRINMAEEFRPQDDAWMKIFLLDIAYISDNFLTDFYFQSSLKKCSEKFAAFRRGICLSNLIEKE